MECRMREGRGRGGRGRWSNVRPLHVSVLLVLLLNAGCHVELDNRSATQVNEASLGQEAVLDAIRSYYDAFSALDSARFVSHFWPDAAITTTWQPAGEDSARVWTQPVERFVASWPDGPGSRAVFAEHLTRAQVQVTGNLAQAWVHYTTQFGDSGDVREWSGIDAFTLMRHGDAWRIVSLVFSADQ